MNLREWLRLFRPVRSRVFESVHPQLTRNDNKFELLLINIPLHTDLESLQSFREYELLQYHGALEKHLTHYMFDSQKRRVVLSKNFRLPEAPHFVLLVALLKIGGFDLLDFCYGGRLVDVVDVYHC